MRINDWQDVLNDIVTTNVEPDGWRAIAGDRAGGIGEDMYLGHPGVGVFHLKTYAKNPFEVHGVGTRVARSIDDDLDPLFPDKGVGHFGIQSPPDDEDDAKEKATKLGSVLETHADAPTTPDALFEDVMDAVDSPAYGAMDYDQYSRSEGLDTLSDEYEEAERLLNNELDDLVAEDEINRGVR